MKITNLSVVLHDRYSTDVASFSSSGGHLPMGVLVISTDEGVDGHCLLSSPGPGPDAIAQQIVRFIKPRLVGEDPLAIGRHWQTMHTALRWSIDPIAAGTVDIALWDLAGKVAGLPIHSMLGTSRTTVPAYFSSGQHATVEAYAEEALHWKEQGWTGYKLHPPTALFHRRPGVTILDDVEAGEAVRAAVGPDMALMMDSSWGYTYADALRVGRAIQDLDFEWYEDPLPAEDIHGYVRLKQQLSIPLMATEITRGGLAALPEWVVRGATDYLRGDVVIKGGITGMMKIAHLAEAFNLPCEVHAGYNALGNVANIHVTMAVPNAPWYEALPFNQSGDHRLDHLFYGITEPFVIDESGLVHAPTRPGLGFDVDWDLINSSSPGTIE